MANSVNHTTVPNRKTKKRGLIWSLKNTSFGESRSYLFEYGLLLLLTGSLLYVLVGMVQAFYEPSISLLFMTSQNFDVLLLSALTVILPLVIILIQRTAEAERHNPTLKNLSWRKGFLGIFLAVISLGAVLTSILFINSVLRYLSEIMLMSADYDWGIALGYLVASGLLILTAWTYGNDYRYVQNDHFSGLRHYYRYLFISLALVIGVLFLFFPFRENRTASVDEQITADLYNISSSIQNYHNDSGQLPDALGMLALQDEVNERSTLYNYTYERKTANTYMLCAKFTTSTNDNSNSTLSNDGTASSLNSANIYVHNAGINCYDFSVSPNAEAPMENSATSSGDASIEAVEPVSSTVGETTETAPTETGQ